jgi:hypothetical protein
MRVEVGVKPSVHTKSGEASRLTYTTFQTPEVAPEAAPHSRISAGPQGVLTSECRPDCPSTDCWRPPLNDAPPDRSGVSYAGPDWRAPEAGDGGRPPRGKRADKKEIAHASQKHGVGGCVGHFSSSKTSPTERPPVGNQHQILPDFTSTHLEDPGASISEVISEVSILVGWRASGYKCL